MSWLSEATGIHLSPQHGFHVDPSTILNNLRAVTGDPTAIAASAGNLVHAVSPNSTLGKLGETANHVGASIGSMGGSDILNNILHGGGGSVPRDPGMSTDGTGGAGPTPGGDIYQAVNGVLSIPRPDDPTPTTASAGGSADNGGGGILNNLTHMLTNGHGGLSNGVLLGLAGAEGVMGANAYSKMGALQNKALQSVENAYSERAPLRTQGLSMMQNTLTHPVNASATFADPGNPYTRPPITLPTAQPAQATA